MKRLPFNHGQALLQSIDPSERFRNIISRIAPADLSIFIVARLAGAQAGN
jgi:hypothetical protein